MSRSIPPCLNYFFGEHAKKTVTEWLLMIEVRTKDAFRSKISWIRRTEKDLSTSILSNGDTMVAVHSGTNEGHLIRIVWVGATYECLLTIKTENGILEANDIANWLSVALSRWSYGIAIQSCDPGDRAQALAEKE